MSYEEDDRGKKGDKNTKDPIRKIINGLKILYKQKILPIEKGFKFDEFHSPSLTDVDFEAKPQVMLIGQYSTGKTTFIRFLLERDFPGSHIGPEPTTDRFVAVMYGPERVIPGNALALDNQKPFHALNKFGMGFLNKFEGSQCTSPILEKITFIDTPGILAGEKQRMGRSYDFPQVVEWWAGRVDRILLLFDAHKLDISDEFEQAILTLKNHPDKIRVVLNKADIPTHKLMRVYGAMMWSLGKIVRTPEVVRVFVGSFWHGKLKFDENKELLESEQRGLLADLRSLPRGSAVRKINELVKRARMVKVHAFIISHLRSQFGFFGKSKTQDKLMNNLMTEFKSIQQKHNLPIGDFPHIGKFKDTLSKYQIDKFPKIHQKSMQDMDTVLSVDIPKLLKLLPNLADDNDAKNAGGSDMHNPFSNLNEEVSGQWLVQKAQKQKWDNEFDSLNLTHGKVSGSNCKNILMRSALPTATLRKLWDLADIDSDGWLDSDEFSVAMYLIEQMTSKEITELPEKLDPRLCPPSKRHLIKF